MISGDLKLNKGRFQLGRASAAAAVPQLNVRETGLDAEDVIEPADAPPVEARPQARRQRPPGHRPRNQQPLDAPTCRSAASPTRRASPAAPTWSRAITISPGATSGSTAESIRFQGESPPNPLLDIHAAGAVQGLDASVIVAGTGLKPEITFASSPPLPQDELLSRILFGTSITNLSAPEALQLASAVAALQSGSGSLDPINALRRAVGLDRLRIVPADIATGQKTAIGAGKYITRKLFVEVVTDGQGYSATQRRISDDPLALAAVDRLDHRPLERERPSQQGLLAQVLTLSGEADAFTSKMPSGGLWSSALRCADALDLQRHFNVQ